MAAPYVSTPTNNTNTLPSRYHEDNPYDTSVTDHTVPNKEYTAISVHEQPGNHTQFVTAFQRVVDDIIDKKGPPRTALGNPGPTGLTLLAAALFLLCVWDTQLLPATTSNVVLPLAFWPAGILLAITGYFELAASNTFGAAAFITYAGFFLSYATLGTFVAPSWSSAGVPAADQALTVALYLLTWTFITLYFAIASLRTSVVLVNIFTVLEIAFILLTAAEFVAQIDANTANALTQAGGWFAIITAATGLYGAAAGLVDTTYGVGLLPVGFIGPLKRSVVVAGQK